MKGVGGPEPDRGRDMPECRTRPRMRAVYGTRSKAHSEKMNWPQVTKKVWLEQVVAEQVRFPY